MGKREIHFTPVGRQVQRVLEYPLRLENRSPHVHISLDNTLEANKSLNSLIVLFSCRCLTQEGQDTLLHYLLMTSVVEGLCQGHCLEARRGICLILRSVSSDAENPGNSLYVTGLSHRVTERDLEDHFAKEGKVVDVTDVHLVLDPWTRESRGFGFISMKSVGDANRCIRSLDHSVLQGRVITVEKARRRRGRTPTPGKYLGLRTARGRHKSPSYSPRRSVSCSRSRSRSYSSDRGRSYSPSYGRRGRSSSYSPFYRRRRFYSPSRSPSPDDRYNRRRDRSYSPYYRRRDRSRSYSRNCRARDRSPYYMRRYRSRSRSYSPRYRARDRSCSPYYRGRDRSYSPHYQGRDRSYSPESRYYRRSVSGSVSPGGRSMSRSISPRKGRKESRSKSRRHDRQSSMCHSRSARSSTSRSVSP
ncbi:F22G5.31 [Arabidopsis thaliana]|nr:F22G5.31 [Arabidopsis thaliana]